MQNRQVHSFNEILGKDPSGSVVVLQESFEYDSGFKGVTGALFDIISAEKVEEQLGGIEDWALEIWQYEVMNGSTEIGLSEWIENNYPTDEEKIEALYDDSYSEMHDEIRETFSIPEDYIISCSGGGRMFPCEIEWLPGKQSVFDPIINKFEGK